MRPDVAARSATRAGSAPRSGRPSRPRRPAVEIGWVMVGRLDPIDRRAVTEAHDRVAALLAELFPDFSWRHPLVEQPDHPSRIREEPARLLEHGAEERDARRWDFVLMITPSDLTSHYQHGAWATPSRSLGIAVISTARIDPSASRGDLPLVERRAILSQRVFALVLHVLGHLLGVEHRKAPPCAML